MFPPEHADNAGKTKGIDEKVNKIYKINMNDETGLGTELSRTERKRGERKAKILDAALALCAEHGLGAMTVQKLADSLDYTAGALYRYFRSKDALVAELEARALEDIADRFRLVGEQWAQYEPFATAAKDEQHLFRILGLAQFYVDLLDTLPEQMHLIGMLMGDRRSFVGDDDTARVAPVFTRMLGGVSDLFRAAQAAGALAAGPPETRMVVFWSSLQGIAQIEKMQRFHSELFDPRRRAPELARALLLGWGANPNTLDRAARLADDWRKSCSEHLQ